MRALLVVNQKATTTSSRVRDVLVHALRSEVDLQVAHTRRRGHAASLAGQARAEGVDAVVVLGGDGTVNEAINGLLAAGVGPDAPAFAVVPGGSTNVFARALGMPPDWVEATGVLLEALRERRYRTIGLGRADDRYFTFCAGLGLDAEVVRRVERKRLRGHASSQLLYFRSAVGQYFLDTDHHDTPITLEQPGEAPEAGLATVIIQNTTPWTYLGGRAMHACPEASFDLGLDVLAMRGLHLPSTMRTALQLLTSRSAESGSGESRSADGRHRDGRHRDSRAAAGPASDHGAGDHGAGDHRAGDHRAGDAGPRGPHGRRLLRLHDIDAFGLRSSEPIGFQLDGDYLGKRDKIRFVAVPGALRVIC